MVSTDLMDVPMLVVASDYCEVQHAIALHILYKNKALNPIPTSSCVLAFINKKLLELSILLPHSLLLFKVSLALPHLSLLSTSLSGCGQEEEGMKNNQHGKADRSVGDFLSRSSQWGLVPGEYG
jgi:hypothetical protein